MKNNYKKLIQEATTFEELDSLKEEFLNECTIRENKIKVGLLLNNINNICDAKHLFESIVVALLPKKEGKKLINNYVNTIKENKSLKTIYTYQEGLNKNDSSDSKKSYITEALSLGNIINNEEYYNGLKNIINIISESFKLLGDKFILENVSLDKTTSKIGDSLYYLSSTKKSIKNLNEYIEHINIVCDNKIEKITECINVDSPLHDIVSSLTFENVNNKIDNIFECNDKEEVFKKNKQLCLNMISEQKKLTEDTDVLNKLNDIENKLNKKVYQFESYTKDMIYMTELQEVLN